ncbi:uncharacterized protein LOC9326723 [Arabidopsis lyrata subsp. lyrata]|uniref:uncharacterized protein LOC9326723 n=1 Tax=Arabidopsis lyrata subsp. lyrata TaxID=81972 RepID=UPI000A29B4E8|nr:uncharacterized protein LOC9326723 [Arabidopsis lyrata subsp. lyrata]|eukprot:XP_020868583.1 uncharacterized protein LOC9326723 [Arabidopsis lyrata subsp. lyrata]
MAELTHADVVYSPRWFQVWKTLVNWLAFFYQILCAVGYHPLLSSSAKASADGFKPLPAIELLDRASSDCEHSRFGSSLDVAVMNSATLKDLKLLIKKKVNETEQANMGNRIIGVLAMCRKHVWSNFCISCNNEKLLDDNGQT